LLGSRSTTPPETERHIGLRGVSSVETGSKDGAHHDISVSPKDGAHHDV
jgi:hypothetical protein